MGMSKVFRPLETKHRAECLDSALSSGSQQSKDAKTGENEVVRRKEELWRAQVRF